MGHFWKNTRSLLKAILLTFWNNHLFIGSLEKKLEHLIESVKEQARQFFFFKINASTLSEISKDTWQLHQDLHWGFLNPLNHFLVKFIQTYSHWSKWDLQPTNCQLLPKEIEYLIFSEALEAWLFWKII